MLKINVGGKYFTTSVETITSCAPNFFTRSFERCGSNYIFIDRDPKFFNLVLNHMRGYTIVLPVEESELWMFYDDAKFYGLTTLIRELDKILFVKLPIQERNELLDYIVNQSFKYDLDFIPRDLELKSDRYLLDLKDKIYKFIHTELYLLNILSAVRDIKLQLAQTCLGPGRP